MASTTPSSFPSTSTILITATTLLTTAGVAYALYFDHQRRTSPAFRRELKKQHKKAHKSLEEEAAAASQDQKERIRRVIAKALEEGFPKDPEETEGYFMQEVARGEGMCTDGSDTVDAALCFFRALKVYPQQSELIDIYNKTVPKQLLGRRAEPHRSKYPSPFAHSHETSPANSRWPLRNVGVCSAPSSLRPRPVGVNSMPPEKEPMLMEPSYVPTIITTREMAQTTPSPLFALPLELREMVYDHVFTQVVFIWTSNQPGGPGLLGTSKDIRREALSRYYASSLFCTDYLPNVGRFFHRKSPRLCKAVTSIKVSLRKTLADLQTPEAWAKEAERQRLTLERSGIPLREGVLLYTTTLPRQEEFRPWP
ncbi:mitochondrial import receptor subunit tom20 [Teratosphaeriaceae sp. CCFEE 6253]|nr:mitochondrial import receptor subunit tom20 [Teratosphaeriaceae sp. CCFEE 6253]